MFAVFEDGSRQYRVQEGDVVQLDYREAEPGTRLEFGRVLLYQNADDLRIGQPLVEGARVLGEVVAQTSVKLYIQHFRRRKNYRRRGHRQHYTRIQVRNILLPGQEPPAAPPPAPAATPAPAPGAAPQMSSADINLPPGGTPTA